MLALFALYPLFAPVFHLQTILLEPWSTFCGYLGAPKEDCGYQDRQSRHQQMVHYILRNTSLQIGRSKYLLSSPNVNSAWTFMVFTDECNGLTVDSLVPPLQCFRFADGNINFVFLCLFRCGPLYGLCYTPSVLHPGPTADPSQMSAPRLRLAHAASPLCHTSQTTLLLLLGSVPALAVYHCLSDFNLRPQIDTAPYVGPYCNCELSVHQPLKTD